MKIHKVGLNCGHWHNEESQENEKVTCKKCLRLIADDKENKLYKVKFKYYDGSIAEKFIEAPTSSKASYKCFKMFMFDDEACSDIGEQFTWYKNDKPKVTRVVDTQVKRSLTEDEQYEAQKLLYIEKAKEFNLKYPIGTKVLFQGDGRVKPVIRTTKSKAFSGDFHLSIFLNDVSGSYLLDDRFIRVLTEENKNLERLRI